MNFCFINHQSSHWGAQLTLKTIEKVLSGGMKEKSGRQTSSMIR